MLSILDYLAAVIKLELHAQRPPALGLPTLCRVVAPSMRSGGELRVRLFTQSLFPEGYVVTL